ncbi:MAG: carbon-nitrogen hydrolase family protein [Candidatus Heimdallarchaeota archaeon]|nr:carbon-nitrogen hydrolase family protein [Candidatus Heimdallarchaeota archaeon]MDH5644865.1 carbon-nitrogen hydrolase family protein [Candidatus Heimdallarchaeota archaeon]
MDNTIKVAAIQISPVFLNAKKTWDKLKQFIMEAKEHGAEIITWGETLIPGYPVWLSRTNGASFDDEQQKKAYAKYYKESLEIDGYIIKDMIELSKKLNIMLIGGIAEKSSGSIYCTLITIENGVLLGRHRKVKPTFEERLVWADGDSNGLLTYNTKIGKIGSLNCWENWIPYARASLHDQDEFIHVAVWPGSIRLTNDISKFMALEGRSWIISVSGFLDTTDFDELTIDEFPFKEKMKNENRLLYDGGSVIINPKGEIVAGPLIGEEGILYAELNAQIVIEERQNFDYSGHYSRKDIFKFQYT